MPCTAHSGWPWAIFHFILSDRRADLSLNERGQQASKKIATWTNVKALGVIWRFGSKSTCPHCWDEGWSYWQQRLMFLCRLHCSQVKRRRRAPYSFPLDRSIQGVTSTLLVFLTVCFGAVPLVYFAFPNHQGRAHHSWTCYAILEALVFSAWTTPPAWGCCNSLPFHPQYWTFEASQRLCPQSPWPVGVQDLLLLKVAVWMLTVSKEYVFTYVPSFLFITLLC